VGTAVLLADGPRLTWVELPSVRAEGSTSLGPAPVAAAQRYLALAAGELPPGVLSALRELPPTTSVASSDPRWLPSLSRETARPVRLASLEELRSARALVARRGAPEDRAFLLAVARLTLERALASPEEVLVSLAREEERLERALGREERAADAFVTVQGTLLAEYAPAWAEARGALAHHHGRLVSLLERAAHEVVPNLAVLVGERVAGRMVAAAGGVAPLGRMSASRIQLLGSRRRPSPERGPRYGVIFRAVRMNDLPVARRGEYARSLAALAAIAARADATTRADLSDLLVARRDRRVEALRRRGR
jgi:snoRNA binding domain, fibrillarin